MVFFSQAVKRALRSNPQLLIILLVLFLSLFLRVIFYVQMLDSPLMYQHEWDQTDMSFFVHWARDIAAGNWAGNKSLHPYHSWHRQVASQVYKSHGEGEYNDDIGKKIWDKWWGQKRFHQEPLYPYFIAAIYKISGGRIRWLFAFQSLMGIMSNLLIYLIARRYFGTIVAAVAASMAILYGPFMFYENVLLRVTMVIFTTLLFCW